MKEVNDDDKNIASGETAPATTKIDDGVEAGKGIPLKKITVIRGWESPIEARLVQEFYQAREEVKVEKSKPVGVAGSNCGGGVELMKSAEFPKCFILKQSFPNWFVGKENDFDDYLEQRFKETSKEKDRELSFWEKRMATQRVHERLIVKHLKHIKQSDRKEKRAARRVAAGAARKAYEEARNREASAKAAAARAAKHKAREEAVEAKKKKCERAARKKAAAAAQRLVSLEASKKGCAARTELSWLLSLNMVCWLLEEYLPRLVSLEASKKGGAARTEISWLLSSYMVCSLLEECLPRTLTEEQIDGVIGSLERAREEAMNDDITKVSSKCMRRTMATTMNKTAAQITKESAGSLERAWEEAMNDDGVGCEGSDTDGEGPLLQRNEPAQSCLRARGSGKSRSKVVPHKDGERTGATLSKKCSKVVHRKDRVQDGKARQSGARLAVGGLSKGGTELLPAMEARQNSLMSKSQCRPAKRVSAEMNVCACNVATLPRRSAYPVGKKGTEQHKAAYMAWHSKNARTKPVQSRTAALYEKRAGNINDWMERNKYAPFAEWELLDPDDPCGEYELRLKKNRRGRPCVPSLVGVCEWAFKFANGQVPKGGHPEYRAGPWYSKIGGLTQPERWMQTKGGKYGYGVRANEPPRYVTIEQNLTGLRRWLKGQLRDFPDVANPLNDIVISELTATLEGDGGRAVVEEYLPRTLTEEEIGGVIATARITKESAGSLERALEEAMNLLYVTKNSVTGTRAHDEYWLDYGEVVPSELGQSIQYVSTKNNKKQCTRKKFLQCNSKCNGKKFVLRADGTADPEKFCVAHLIEHIKSLLFELLGRAPPKHVPFLGRWCKVSKLSAGTTLVQSAKNSVAEEDAPLCVCVVTAEEAQMGYCYDRTVPFEYNGKEYYPPQRGYWFEVEGTGFAVRAFADAAGVTECLQRQLKRTAERDPDVQIGDITKVASKSMRRTMATIMSKTVSMPELVTIGEWSCEEMARRYIESLNCIVSVESRNYSDVPLVAAVNRIQEQSRKSQARKQQGVKPRVPYGEKQLSAAEVEHRERHKTPCHPRKDGERNPLTKWCITDEVAKLLHERMMDPVQEVRAALCKMGCHVSCMEIESYRQPRRRQLQKLSVAGMPPPSLPASPPGSDDDTASREQGVTQRVRCDCAHDAQSHEAREQCNACRPCEGFQVGDGGCDGWHVGESASKADDAAHGDESVLIWAVAQLPAPPPSLPASPHASDDEESSPEVIVVADSSLPGSPDCSIGGGASGSEREESSNASAEEPLICPICLEQCITSDWGHVKCCNAPMHRSCLLEHVKSVCYVDDGSDASDGNGPATGPHCPCCNEKLCGTSRRGDYSVRYLRPGWRIAAAKAATLMCTAVAVKKGLVAMAVPMQAQATHTL
jgi:hypothetical protein